MKFLRSSSLRNSSNDEKHDYANFSQSRIITLFQVPHYEHLQILICNGNSLTTLAGVENIKHLWKLDVSNNQIRSLQHLSRFIAFGSLILSNNNLSWIELQHIRHMSILDFRVDGNPLLDLDSNYRHHVLDCLPRVWMCDGIFVSTAERNEVDEFFTQSSLTTKPVRRKLARDIFMPTNLKDRSVNGLFGSKATDLFAKFPLNCFVNPEFDRKRIKHLASTIEEIIFTEFKHKQNDLDKILTENRHVLHQIIELRQTHVEQFNMILILLTSDILFHFPEKLLDDVFSVTHIKSIGNLNLFQLFSSSEQFKCTVASLIHGAARVDRDENHPSAFYDKLFQSLSIVLTNQVRQLSNNSTISSVSPPVHLSGNSLSEAKTLLCLEVMQVFIMCPMFYVSTTNQNVEAFFKQALERSTAFHSIQDVLASLRSEQKTAMEQRDLLCPMLANILKTSIRTLLSKRAKRVSEPIVAVTSTTSPLPPETQSPRKNLNETDSTSQRPTSRPGSRRAPAIGDRILVAPQSLGRIVTLPDAEIAMVQLDNVLAVNGSMVSTGSLFDHTTYITIRDFEWSPPNDYWKLKQSVTDRVTIQYVTTPCETPRPVMPLPMPAFSPNPLPSQPMNVSTETKTNDSTIGRPATPKQNDINPQIVTAPPEEVPTLNIARSETPPLNSNPFDQSLHTTSEVFPTSPPPTPPAVEQKLYIADERTFERPMSVRITRQRSDKALRNSLKVDHYPNPPVLIESTLLLVPDRAPPPTAFAFEKPRTGNMNNSLNVQDLDSSRTFSFIEQPTPIPSMSTGFPRPETLSRVPVPVHDASQWFIGPNLQNERSNRMEKVVSSLMRRSSRPISNYGMPKVPHLSSPSSRDHAYYRGVRPGSFQDFRLESHRVTPVEGITGRQSVSFRARQNVSPMHTFSLSRTPTNPTTQHVNRVKSLLNPPRSTPN